MTPLILTLAILNQPHCHISKYRVKRLSRIILKVEKQYNLPNAVLAAIVLAETGGRNVVVREVGKNKTGADVGPFQIHCPGPNPDPCIKKYRSVYKGARRAGYILSIGRKICKNNPRIAWYCKVKSYGWIARYNPRSRTWYPRVIKIWKNINKFIEEYEENELEELKQ